MTVFRNDDLWDRSNVQFEDGRLLRYDKVEQTPDMRHIDYGLGVLTARSLGPFPSDGPFDLAPVYQQLLADGNLAALEVTDRFYEIGSPAGLQETREFLAAKEHGQTLNHELRTTASQGNGRDRSVAGRRWHRENCQRARRRSSRGGRLFFLGVGGSAGNCSHAVNDFRSSPASRHMPRRTTYPS